MCVCARARARVYYLSLKSIRVSIKLPIFKPFITILSTYIFFKVTCDVDIAQCKYRTIKCDLSGLPTCEYGVPKKVHNRSTF